MCGPQGTHWQPGTDAGTTNPQTLQYRIAGPVTYPLGLLCILHLTVSGEHFQVKARLIFKVCFFFLRKRDGFCESSLPLVPPCS